MIQRKCNSKYFLFFLANTSVASLSSTVLKTQPDRGEESGNGGSGNDDGGRKEGRYHRGCIR